MKMNNLCDCCETAEGIKRGEFIVCDDCNSDNQLFCKCRYCNTEKEAGEMLYDEIGGVRYCDDDCYYEGRGKWPDDETYYGKGGDKDAWDIILRNKREREARTET